jgi:hypothetical protein
MLILAILNVFQSTPLVPPEFLIIANSIVNVVLRFITVDAIWHVLISNMELIAIAIIAIEVFAIAIFSIKL